jgi:hypothetical protein
MGLISYRKAQDPYHPSIFFHQSWNTQDKFLLFTRRLCHFCKFVIQSDQWVFSFAFQTVFNTRYYSSYPLLWRNSTIPPLMFQKTFHWISWWHMMFQLCFSCWRTRISSFPCFWLLRNSHWDWYRCQSNHWIDNQGHILRNSLQVDGVKFVTRKPWFHQTFWLVMFRLI